ncbi:biopolymer transporter ExbD [Roseibium polysiphoniae]|uniref:ExbD/TolR family protein n=1 Tax=Roseibium polysiphoniae TaxID=2571221 RepID=UPI0032986BC0
MKKLSIAPIKRKSENTISLINIVFLMLIFFLIAGQLAPPLDKTVDLIDSKDADPLPPPNALVAREDGSLHFRGSPTTIEAFLQEAASLEAVEEDVQSEQAGFPVRLIADRDLAATALIGLVGELQAAGAGKVTVVTMRAQ